jgi:hypothetical protein
MSIEKIPDEGDEALRFENEFLKVKFLAEHGALNRVFFPGKEISLELENELLNAIASDDETMENVEEVSIYDFIGRPDFVKETELTDAELSAELDRVNDLLEAKKIIYTVLASVEDRVIYKFVTEELFLHPILNLPDSEIGTHHFYEDFHPDHEYDTRNRCEEFIAIFFSADFHISIRNCSMERIRNFVDLIEFHDAFEEFRNVEFELSDAAAVPTECIRKATISFDAVTSAGTKPIHFSGEATFELEYEYEWWTVISAQFPGMP